MRAFLWSAIFTVLLVSRAWSLETMTVTGSGSSIPGGSPIFDPPGVVLVELAQFDPALGSLESVELTIQAEHAGTFTFTANGPNQRYRIIYLDWSYEVQGFGDMLLIMDWVTTPTQDEPFGGPPGHFNTPLTSVPEGETHVLPYGNSLSYSADYSSEDPEFGGFIGDGVFTIEMLDWMVFSVMFYGGNYTWSLETTFTLEVTAVYHYDAAVPTENSSWGNIKALFH